MSIESRSFAEAWVEAWNARDLERILDHYAADIVFLSPVAARRLGDGRVNGIAALREYWSAALAAIPDLRFTLEAVLSGHQCLTILYRNQRGQLVAETVEFDSAGKVCRSVACYDGAV
ncbi:nuclear transport factor 2 family protein [Devosia sp. A16]|uniref:nuclear transport factor 2 family protein n=1 Tax=Devosia sp. A16 TaxID=1736675 RepID=UPI0006D7F54D|nr:nuclear transport factor 2 family protein [Devosia sp. A16]